MNKIINVGFFYAPFYIDNQLEDGLVLQVYHKSHHIFSNVGALVFHLYSQKGFNKPTTWGNTDFKNHMCNLDTFYNIESQVNELLRIIGTDNT